MIVLYRPCPQGPPPLRQVILIFGLGLIGRSILQAVQHQTRAVTLDLAFGWAPGSSQHADAERIIACIAAVGALPGSVTAGPGLSRIDIVWSAGRAGFNAAREQLDTELRSFATVLWLATRLREAYPGIGHGFHLMSSAGGLFEGQCAVGAQSVPLPRRPYAETKLEQEQQLRQQSGNAVWHIYRPSTVYGFVAPDTRQGLISTLIVNGIRREVTRVFGQPGTLRDYVPAADVGRFVARRLWQPPAGPTTCLLASAKPSTILELIQLTETLLDRRLYTMFQPGSDNAENQTFAAAALPQHWDPTELRTGIQQTLLRVLCYAGPSANRKPGTQGECETR